MDAVGIDVGSTYTKYCAMKADRMELFSEPTPVMQKEYFRTKLEALRGMYPGCPVVTCGYGRHNIWNSRSVTELTALAAGAGFQCPDSGVVLDIGGQDTKLACQEGGKLKAFFVNEKCAAGSGIFLKNVLNLLQLPYEAIDLTAGGRPALHLSSVCAVFAQSEITGLIADGVPGESIAAAVLEHILLQAKALLRKVDCAEVTLSGGLTKIPGIGEFAGRVLGKKVVVPENGACLSAIGCAVLGCAGGASQFTAENGDCTRQQISGARGPG